MYSQYMNLVSLGQGFLAPSRIMVRSACRVHQSGKNMSAGSLKTKALQSLQMSGTTHSVTLCQHLKALNPHDIFCRFGGWIFCPQKPCTFSVYSILLSKIMAVKWLLMLRIEHGLLCSVCKCCVMNID
jgi:hypothetical protein